MREAQSATWRGTTTATVRAMTIPPFESVSDAMLEATSGGSFRQSWSRWAEEQAGPIARDIAWAGGLMVDAVTHPRRVLDAMRPPKPSPPPTGAITG